MTVKALRKSVLKQFPFLDPNTVQAAKANDLSMCYHKIDAPLIPVYLRPMSEQQVEQIKQRWDDQRYARVDLWRQLSSRSARLGGNRDAALSGVERDYQLTEKSLSQLQGLLWMAGPDRPKYFLAAIENRIKALKLRSQAKRQAWSTKRCLEKTRSRQLPQTEHISFLLAALLETARCVDEAPPLAEKQRSSEQQGKATKGGGAYEIGNVSPEK